MIRELELRLAEVLGERLPAPFAGRVDAAPVGGPPGAAPQIVVGVRRADRLRPDFSSLRHEVVPGAGVPRRVVRLACDLALEVQPGSGADRAQQVAGVDALVYALDDPALLGALSAPGDPGFLLDTLDLVEAGTPLHPTDPQVGAVGVSVRAVGMFWPVGVPGQAGDLIDTIRLREASLPVEVVLPAERLVAGGPAAAVGLRLPATGTLLVDADGTTAAPFGRLAVRLAAPGGKPGKGTLTGGTAGTPAGVRLVELARGAAELTYTPPAEPADDVLVVALDDGDGGAGVELGRTPLPVGSP